MTEEPPVVLVIGSAIGRHICTYVASDIPVMIVEDNEIAKRAAALLDAQHAFREQIFLQPCEIHAANDWLIPELANREQMNIGRKGRNRRKW